MNNEKIRSYFPLTEKTAYFTTNAIGPLSSAAAEAVESFKEMALLDPARIYRLQDQIITDCRAAAARLMCVESEAIALTRNTSEGLLHIARLIRWSAEDEVLVLENDFPTIYYSWKTSEHLGFSVRMVPSEYSRITVNSIKKHVTSKTRVICLGTVQWNTGFVPNIREIGKFCRENGIFFIVDACLSLGSSFENPSELYIDALVGSSYKFLHSTPGLGLLYCNDRIREVFRPASTGWRGTVHEGYTWSRAPNLLKNSYSTPVRTDMAALEEGTGPLLSAYALTASIQLLLTDIGTEHILNRLNEMKVMLIQTLTEIGFSPYAELKYDETAHILRYDIPGGSREQRRIQVACSRENVQIGFLENSLMLAVSVFTNEDDIRRLARTLLRH